MSVGVFVAVLVAAFLHALWNALIKLGVNKQTSMLILSLWQGVIGICVGVSQGLPIAAAWPWLIASGIIHMFYQLFLAFAYEQGDLSRVYPIARGAAPLIVVIFSLLALPDPVALMEYAGIAVLGLGIVLLARGAFASGESRRLVPYALGSACATAGYSIVDGLGARVSGDPVLFVGWLLFMSAVFYCPAILAIKGTSILRAPAKAWGVGFFAALLSLLAYGIVVWAMTLAPIALVTALRETSILFAVLIGWLVFGEKMNAGKAVAAALIIFGVLMTRLA